MQPHRAVAEREHPTFPEHVAHRGRAMRQPSEYVRINREGWTKANAEHTDARAHEHWSAPEVTWGVWGTPERLVHALPDVTGRDVIELGCGTAYFSAWMKRGGARRVVGVDITPAQLSTARRMDADFGLGLELIEANAEAVPIGDATFDLAISEYGASIWCDPYRWIPEAARLLRAGGELVFLCNSPIMLACTPGTGPVEEHVIRPLRGMHQVEWTDDDPGVEFHLGHGDLFRLLRETGFEVLDLIELYASEEVDTHSYYDFVDVAWARKWPSEEIWRARKR